MSQDFSQIPVNAELFGKNSVLSRSNQVLVLMSMNPRFQRKLNFIRDAQGVVYPERHGEIHIQACEVLEVDLTSPQDTSNLQRDWSTALAKIKPRHDITLKQWGVLKKYFPQLRQYTYGQGEWEPQWDLLAELTAAYPDFRANSRKTLDGLGNILKRKTGHTWSRLLPTKPTDADKSRAVTIYLLALWGMKEVTAKAGSIESILLYVAGQDRPKCQFTTQVKGQNCTVGDHYTSLVAPGVSAPFKTPAVRLVPPQDEVFSDVGGDEFMKQRSAYDELVREINEAAQERGQNNG